MAGITNVAKQIGVSGQTIKNWTGKYPDSFSIAAKRKYDKQFDAKDIKALKKLQALKLNGLTAQQIKEKLPLRPQEIDLEPEYEQEYQEPPLIDGNQSSSVMIIQQMLAGKDEVISQLTNERDYLREQLEDERRSHWRIRKPGK